MIKFTKNKPVRGDNLVASGQKAFTLVELSIVLVIIGLLTAGVVGGQSLIESAENQKIISEISGYKTAINAFKLEYDAIPGDFTQGSSYWTNCTTYAVYSPGCNGNGNGIIDGTWPAESHAFWAHLMLAGIIPLKKESTNDYTYMDAAVKGTVYLVDYGARLGTNLYGPTSASVTNSKNFLFLAKQYPGVNSDGSVLNAKRTKAIDSKIDDGLPLQGNMLAGTGSYDSNSVECISGTTYLLTSTAKSCNMMFNF